MVNDNFGKIKQKHVSQLILKQKGLFKYSVRTEIQVIL